MRQRSKSVLKSILVAASLSAAILAASATPAAAKSFAPRGRAHSQANVVVRGRGHVVAPRPFVAPRHVAFRTVRTYDPFYARRVFFAPHNHFHVVYNFPVYTAYGVAYEPYTYCGDDLYDGYGYPPSGYVSFRGPRFGVAFGF